MRNQKGYTIVEIFYVMGIIIILIGAVGWVKNIIKLVDCDFEAPYKAEVIHAAGLIPPVGAITGWLDVGK